MASSYFFGFALATAFAGLALSVDQDERLWPPLVLAAVSAASMGVALMLHHRPRWFPPFRRPPEPPASHSPTPEAITRSNAAFSAARRRHLRSSGVTSQALLGYFRAMEESIAAHRPASAYWETARRVNWNSRSSYAWERLLLRSLNDEELTALVARLNERLADKPPAALPSASRRTERRPSGLAPIPTRL